MSVNFTATLMLLFSAIVLTTKAAPGAEEEGVFLMVSSCSLVAHAAGSSIVHNRQRRVSRCPGHVVACARCSEYKW